MTKHKNSFIWLFIAFSFIGCGVNKNTTDTKVIAQDNKILQTETPLPPVGTDLPFSDISPSPIFSLLPKDGDLISPTPYSSPGTEIQLPQKGEYKLVSDRSYDFYKHFSEPLDKGKNLFVFQDSANIYCNIYDLDKKEVTSAKLINVPEAEKINSETSLYLSSAQKNKDEIDYSYCIENRFKDKTQIYINRFNFLENKIGIPLEIAPENNLKWFNFSSSFNENGEIAISYFSMINDSYKGTTSRDYRVYKSIFLNVCKYSKDNHLVFKEQIKLQTNNFQFISTDVNINKNGEILVIWDDLINTFYMKKYSTNGTFNIIKENIITGNIPLGILEKDNSYFIPWLVPERRNMTKLDSNLNIIKTVNISQEKSRYYDNSSFSSIFYNNKNQIILSFPEQTNIYDNNLNIIKNIPLGKIVSEDSSGNYLSLRYVYDGTYFKRVDDKGNIIK